MRIEESLLRIQSIQQAQDRLEQKNAQTGGNFETALNRAMGESTQLTFSKHAGNRLAERGIGLSAQDMERLGAAVFKAGQKGVRNTLVLMDSNAFIVNVPSQTVITAINGGEAKENVYTQIDGAVIA